MRSDSAGWRTRAGFGAALVIACAVAAGLIEAMALLRARWLRRRPGA